MVPELDVVVGRFNPPASVMLPALKLPPASRLTIVLAVLALAAVVPSVKVPVPVETVMSELPANVTAPWSPFRLVTACPPAAAMVTVCPLGVSVTLLPAARVTLSYSVFAPAVRLFTT